MAKAVKKTKKQQSVQVRVEAPNYEILEVTVGNKGMDSTLITRACKDTEWMKDLDNNKKGTRTKARPVRDIKKEYEDGIYRMPGSKTVHGLPASGFKHAMTRVAKGIDGFTMADFKCMVFVMSDAGGLVKMKHTKPTMSEKIVRIGPQKIPQLRYRPEYKEWSVDLKIRYDADQITCQEVLNLISRAGLSIGWGELRPEKGYDHGMYRIQGEAKVVECAA